MPAAGRALPAGVVAERAFTSPPTLQRVERRDTSVSIGSYAGVLGRQGSSMASAVSPIGRDVAGLVAKYRPK
jgi:hypothetical protein